MYNAAGIRKKIPTENKKYLNKLDKRPVLILV